MVRALTPLAHISQKSQRLLGFYFKSLVNACIKHLAKERSIHILLCYSYFILIVLAAVIQKLNK
tara:strand:+ start:36 stop:227 length:192 start_codon:yes stop_codon:yes gene_type:complete